MWLCLWLLHVPFICIYGPWAQYPLAIYICVCMGLVILALIASMSMWLLLYLSISLCCPLFWLTGCSWLLLCACGCCFNCSISFLYMHIWVMSFISSDHLHVCIYGIDGSCSNCSDVHVVLVVLTYADPLFYLADCSFIYIYTHVHGWWAPHPLIIYMCVYIGLMILTLIALMCNYWTRCWC